MENIILQVSLEFWGAFFSIIIATVLFFEGMIERRPYPPLLWAVVTNIILLYADIVAYLFRGSLSVHAFWIVRISNLLVFCCTPFLGYFVLKFIEQSIRSNGGKLHPHWFRALLVLGAFDLVLVLQNLFTGNLYYFDAQNIYHRSSLFPLCTGFAVLFLLILLEVLFVYKSYIPKTLLYSLIAYLLLPLFSSVVQLAYYGLSLNNIALTLGLDLVFISHQNERNHQMFRQSIQLMDQQVELAKKDAQLVEKQTQLALSQIRPHFIFNSLGSIEQMCKTDPSHAADALHRFSRYLRTNLNSLSDPSPVHFSDELKHINTYVWLEKMRFGEDLNYSEHIEADDFLLPALSIQPLVENAIKHGMAHSEDILNVTLSSYETDDQYIITIEDNGGGFDPSAHADDRYAHIGIQSVRDRFHAFNGTEVTIDSTLGEGTLISIVLPKNVVS